MTRCSCWLARLAMFLTRRAASTSVLLILGIIHPLIHGTPIDGGSLDAAFASLQAWAVTNLQVGSE